MRCISGKFLSVLVFVLGAQWAAVLNAQQSPAPAKPEPAIEVDAQLIGEIFDCVKPGLTREWNRAWIVITPVGSYDIYLAELFVAASPSDRKGKPLPTPCEAPQFGEFVRRLNEYLTPAQKKWRSASIQFMRDGKFEIKFDKP
jgi:hypothetical protein